MNKQTIEHEPEFEDVPAEQPPPTIVLSKKNIKQNKENTIKDQTKLIQLLQKIKRDKLRTTRSQKRAEVPQQE